MARKIYRKRSPQFISGDQQLRWLQLIVNGRQAVRHGLPTSGEASIWRTRPIRRPILMEYCVATGAIKMSWSLMDDTQVAPATTAGYTGMGQQISGARGVLCRYW